MTIHDHSNEVAHIHRLGDGRHDLPVKRIRMRAAQTPVPFLERVLEPVIEPGLEPDLEPVLESVDSRGCILLLFVCWAQRLNYDAAEIHCEAYPQAPALRPDLLLSTRHWVEIPPAIDVDLLCSDLNAIDRSSLVETIGRIRAGLWRPQAAFTHWVVTDDGRIAGEARDLEPQSDREPDRHGQYFCFVRLFAMPEMAEWGYSNAANLRMKAEFRD